MMRLKLLEAEKQQKGGKQAAAAADDIVKYDITVKANMKPGRKYRFPVPGSVQGTYERVTFKIPEDATRVSSDGSEMEEDDSSDDDGTPNRGRRRSSYLEMRSIALAEAPARAEDTSPRFHRRSERL